MKFHTHQQNKETYQPPKNSFSNKLLSISGGLFALAMAACFIIVLGFSFMAMSSGHDLFIIPFIICCCILIYFRYLR